MPKLAPFLAEHRTHCDCRYLWLVVGFGRRGRVQGLRCVGMAWPPNKNATYKERGKLASAFSVPLSFSFAACLCYVALVVLLGGSPRPEVASVPILRGSAVFFAILGIQGLSRHKVCQAAPWGVIALAFLVVLPFFHLFPLPPGWVNALSGREVLGEIDRAMGTERIWRPLSMSPLGTVNALLAASVPLAALILGLSIPNARHHQLTQWFLGLGMISLCLALGQMLSPQGSALYFYETTNVGSPVGLFANRNHHAVFLACLIVVAPIALSVDRTTTRRSAKPISEWLKSGLLLLLCLWIAGTALLTGSRSGLLAISLALLSVPVIRNAQARAVQSGSIAGRSTSGLLRSLVLIMGLGAIIPFAMWVERAPALDRLLGSDLDAGARLKILPQVLDLTWLYWPWGSGVGSFEKVFQLHEPAHLLNSAYMNHAHNDVLEVVMTGGLLALGILLAAFIFWLVLVFRVFVIDRSDELQALRKAGVVIISLLSLASLTDYPLRNPSLAALFALAWIWAALPYRLSLTR